MRPEASGFEAVRERLEAYKHSLPDWHALSLCYIYNRALKAQSPRPTCGKILLHAKRQVTAFRERVGLGLSVFKIGVTANLAQRFLHYWLQNYTCMWVIHVSDDCSLTHMLEAALIAEFGGQTGCRNAINSGGEGALNRRDKNDPGPFFVYVCGGRADQLKRVG